MMTLPVTLSGPMTPNYLYFYYVLSLRLNMYGVIKARVFKFVIQVGLTKY